MSQPSAKSFLKLLERSGIVENNQLKETLAKILKQAPGKTVGLAELANHLVDSGLITRWHTDQLIAGKYKGFFLGKYKLLRHLGTGGMSTVYLAQHRVSNQLRAIKVLPKKKVADKSYLDRFYLEARAAASLSHPNVVRIYDICNEGQRHYMVMEYVQGDDLYETVTNNGPLSFQDAIKFTAQAAEGLAHAHNRDLVHRDIKPANLLKTKNGEVKVLDLGLALVNQDDSESLTVLYNEKVMGTADYLSPEQAVNSHNVDLRADIYSLGCTLYFFLVGHPPFPKGTLAQRIAMHQTQQPPSIWEGRPDCPEALVEICEKMMNKEPDQRYQNCDEVKTVLLSLLETGWPDNPPNRPQRKTAQARTVAQPPRSEFAIDTAAANSKKLSARSSSKISGDSADDESAPQTPVPRRRVKAPPKWFVWALITFMFIVLIIALVVAISFV